MDIDAAKIELWKLQHTANYKYREEQKEKLCPKNHIYLPKSLELKEKYKVEKE